LPFQLEGDPRLAILSLDFRIGIKCDLYRSFLEDPDSGAVINPNIHSTIALTFLGEVSHAISKEGNPYKYVVSYPGASELGN